MRRLLLAASLLLAAVPARAQFVQYNAPGSLGGEAVTTKEQLEATMELARWDLGPLRIGPWFELRDVSWVQDLAGADADIEDFDLTATASAGLHAYVPFSRKLTLGAYWLPEYVWWQDNDERSLWNWRYGAGLFGYFNRLTVELRYVDERQQQYFSSEFEQLVNVNQTGPRAALDIEFLRRLHLFGSYTMDEWRYREEDLPGDAGATLLGLDRDEEIVTAGLRYTPGETVSIGAGYKWFTTDFVDPGDDRSSDGGGPTIEVNLSSKRLRFDTSLTWMELEPTDPQSAMVGFDELSGDAVVAWKPGAKLEFQLYGFSRPTYSLIDASPYYMTERLGLAVALPIGRSLATRAYWEDGQDIYSEIAGVREERRDDVSSLGLDFDLPLGRGLSFHLGGSSTEYRSDQPGTDRTVERVQMSLRLSGPGSGWW
jgi:hypothetical protein